MLASCCSDGTVKIWEEQESRGHVAAEQQCGVYRRWCLKNQLNDSRKAVRDVAFAPHHLGLRIATVLILFCFDILFLDSLNLEATLFEP